MPLYVKVCGITNLEDARYCAGAGADFLGFVQYPESPRYVAPEAARAILAWIHGPAPVGVFVDEDADAVNRICAEVGFALAQLHGEEPPEVCAAVERPVIKAVGVAPGDTAEALRRRLEPYRAHVAFFLLDTHHAGLRGGTGQPFDWRQARDLSADFPILLAGGLGADNLDAAVRAVQPAGVDLSSSLEAYPGKKDFDKLGAFFDVFNALRAAQATG